METKDILKRVDSLKIDSRVSLAIASYFCAKLRKGRITEETIDKEILNFKDAVKRFEFIKSSNFKALYEKNGGILTLNKEYIEKSNSNELVPLTFMKVEEAVRTSADESSENKDVLVHIKSFLESIKLTKELNLPINSDFKEIYNILKNTFGSNGKYLDDEIKEDRSLELICKDADEMFNNLIAGGDKGQKTIYEIINLYRYKVLTDVSRMIDVTEFNYKKDVQTVINSINALASNGYVNLDDVQPIIKSIEDETEKKEEIKIDNNEKGIENTRLQDEILKRSKQEPEKLTQQYIESRVKELIKEKPEYDRRICSILPEFFIRSSIIYNWNKDDFEERINNFDTSIQKISFEEMEDIYIAGNTAMGEIKLNSNMFLNSRGNLDNSNMESLVRTFFHESGHITDDTVREGNALKERLGRVFTNNLFYEWSNTVFERAIMGDIYKDDTALTLSEKSGYETFSNVGSMISAALGLEEIEIAKLKDAGLEETKKFFDEKFSYYPNLFEDIRKNFYVPSLKIEGSKARAMYQHMYKNIYNLSVDILEKRVKSEVQNGEFNNFEEYEQKQGYLLKKINTNYKIACKKFGKRREAKNTINKIDNIKELNDKKILKNIGQKIKQNSNYEFENEELLLKLKNNQRKPTLRETLRNKFDKVPLLEAPKQAQQVKNTSEKDITR